MGLKAHHTRTSLSPLQILDFLDINSLASLRTTCGGLKLTAKDYTHFRVKRDFSEVPCGLIAHKAKVISMCTILRDKPTETSRV